MTQNYSIDNIDIILISICSLLLILLLIFLTLFIKNRKNKRKNKKENSNFKSKSLEQEIIKYKNLNENLKLETEKYLNEISKITDISIEDAKDILMNETEKFYKEELSKEINYLKKENQENLNEISSNILVNSMEQIWRNVITKTSSYISVDEEKKGRLIGKNGSMINAFEKITGADIKIEKDADVVISCFNPLKREIAIRTFKELLKLKLINFKKVEEEYIIQCEKINDEMINIGKKTIVEDLGLENYIPKGLYYYVGRLYYRNSFTQSVLAHSIECALISSNIARELGLDYTKAKLCGFLHDIGKSIDYEENNDHVESGIKLAEKFNLPDYVINTIHSHHGNIKSDNIYSTIAKIADGISAARPGIRKINSKEHIERIESIEVIAKSIKGVKNAYALKSGRVVKVIIDSKITDIDEINILEKKLLSEFHKNKLNINIPIRVEIIREKNR